MDQALFYLEIPLEKPQACLSQPISWFLVGFMNRQDVYGRWNTSMIGTIFSSRGKLFRVGSSLSVQTNYPCIATIRRNFGSSSTFQQGLVLFSSIEVIQSANTSGYGCAKLSWL
jgi:hypothetical protein